MSRSHEGWGGGGAVGFHRIWDGSSLYPGAGTVAPISLRHLNASLLLLFVRESRFGSPFNPPHPSSTRYAESV